MSLQEPPHTISYYLCIYCTYIYMYKYVCQINVAPCLCRGVPRPPLKQIGSLFNIRQYRTSRDASKYNRSSMSSSYLSMSWLVPANTNSMLGPPQAIA